ncbi:hypothetical protein [Metamycoplasma canadense]|uniref:Uncharacterized protein n=1 Tax=Metamycoplasma canadense TaxID=29554 RepID=A0A077LCE5_9BACT|nr:hypothetical protein [Metamycoplasma canadense]BAP39759.1 hypothetical protein MCAN360_0718 [Metamycoplasma canadense]
MICTWLLTTEEDVENFSILPILDLTDFVIYKKISKKPFFNSTLINTYLEKNDKEIENLFFDENQYFLCPYKRFYDEYKEESKNEIVVNLNKYKNINKFKIKQLENLLNIIKTNNEKNGGLILAENNFYYIFADPNVVKKQFEEILTKKENQENVNYVFDVFQHFLPKLKKSNDMFLDNENQISKYVKTIVVMNIEKTLFDLKEESEIN